MVDHGFDFSGVLARPKTYENGHKNIFGLSVVLELKVKKSTILTFKVIFLCQKLGLILVTKYIKNQSYPNMSVIKVGLLIFFNEKNHQKDFANF